MQNNTTITSRTIETRGPNLDHFFNVKIYYGPSTFLIRQASRRDDLLAVTDEIDAPRPQRSREHEADVYFVDAQNITRAKNLLAHAAKTRQLTDKQLRELIYRIEITHPY